MLVAVGDEHQRVATGLHGFVNGVLNQWLVDDRQHFLRHGLGGREKAGAKSRDREYGSPDRPFPYFNRHQIFLTLRVGNATTVEVSWGTPCEPIGSNSGTAARSCILNVSTSYRALASRSWAMKLSMDCAETWRGS